MDDGADFGNVIGRKTTLFGMFLNGRLEFESLDLA
jgi:hypothetical protein